MLRALLSLLTLLSTLLLLLTAFLLLHSLHHLDTWSFESSTGIPITSVYLDVYPSAICFNFWTHEDDAPDNLSTILEHTAYPSEPPTLRDGRSITSFLGLSFAHGPRASTHHSYFGLRIRSVQLLLLFSILPAIALFKVFRHRSPPRLLHHLVTTLSLASLALALFLVIAWIKSFSHDHIAVSENMFAARPAYFLSSQGITYWYFFDSPLLLDHIKIWRVLPGQTSMLAGTMDPASRFLGFGRTKSTYLHYSLFSGPSAPRPFTILAIPYYALLAAALLLPTMVTVHRARGLIRHLRKKKGQCPHCGYDLRATPDHCPECGATIESPSSTAPIPATVSIPELLTPSPPGRGQG